MPTFENLESLASVQTKINDAIILAENLSSTALTALETTAAAAAQAAASADLAVSSIKPLSYYGAVGDGVTDDTAAIIAAVASGRVVEGNNLTYKITSAGIALTSNTGFKNCVFDCSEITGGPGNNRSLDTVFTATGTAGTAYSLAADAVRASGPNTYVQVASSEIASTFASGDLVMLKSSEMWDASTNVGEYQMVRRVDGVNVYLQHPLRYNYTTANSATITKVTPVSGITFENVVVTGTIADTLADESAKLGFFDGLYVKDVVLQSCKFNGWNRAGGVVRWGWNTRVEGCEFSNIYEYYGFLFANGSRFNWFQNNYGYNTRHMFSTGSSITYGGGILLDTYVRNNFASGRDASLDAHPGADGIIFEGNTVEGSGEVSSAGGIFINCANPIVQNNYVRGYLNGGITVQTLFTNQVYAGSVMVSNNLIEVLGGPSGNTGITIQTGTNGDTAVPSAITVSGNLINGAAAQGIYVLHLSTLTPLEHLNIGGNTIVGSPTGIQVRSNTDQGIEGGRIGNNLISGFTTGCRLRADSVTAFLRGVSITGNTFVDGTTGIDFIGSATFSDNAIEPNFFHNVSTPIAAAVRTHTIASGAITLRVTSGQILVDTEGAAATDDLTTINGGIAGNRISLRCANAARDVVVKHGTGLNATRLVGAADMTLGETRHNITLECESGPRWNEVSRASPS